MVTTGGRLIERGLHEPQVDPRLPVGTVIRVRGAELAHPPIADKQGPNERGAVFVCRSGLIVDLDTTALHLLDERRGLRSQQEGLRDAPGRSVHDAPPAEVSPASPSWWSRFKAWGRGR